MKKILCYMLVICLFFPLVFFSSVNAEIIGDVEYWYSNQSKIGLWTNAVTACPHSVSNGYTFIVNATMSSISNWNNAGVPVNLSWGGETIPIYGGLAADLEVYCPGITGYSGMSYYSCTFAGYLIYNGSKKSCYTMNSAKCGVVYYPGKSSNGYIKTTSHELGHCLGWMGHSANSSDIMYAYSSEIAVLTSRDINHLVQVYE